MDAHHRQTHRICCPNCGKVAARHYYASTAADHHKCPGRLVTQVECPKCDYYLSSCAVNGQVIEAYTGLAATMPETLITSSTVTATCRS